MTSIPSPILVKQPSNIPAPILVKQPSNIPSPILVPPKPAPVDLNSTRVHSSVERKVNAFFKTNRRPTAMGPMNPERFASTDVTPKNEFGVSRTAYDVNGELW